MIIKPFKKILEDVSGSGKNISLETTRRKFKKPPLPGGNTKQEQYNGDNLLKFSARTSSANGTSYVCDSKGNVTLTGTSSVSSGIGYNQQADESILNAGTYKFKVIGTGFEQLNFRRSDIDTNMTLDNNNEAVVVIAEDNTSFRIVIMRTNGATYNANFRLTLARGTEATEEYYIGGQPTPNINYPENIYNLTGDVEVKVQNKNLFDNENATIRNNAYINYNTGAIAGSSTTNYALENYIEIEASAIYTLANATSGMRLAFYDENETYISGKNNTFIGFTTPSNAKYIRFSDIDLSTVMLIKGNSTVIPYTPHQEQTFTFPLGTERMYLGDYLANDGIHHVRKQGVFDGSNDEGWSYRGQDVDGTYVYETSLSNAKVPINNATKANMLCSHFTVLTSSYLWNNADLGIALNTSKQLRVRTSQSTLEDFKTWLASNPITVEYELDEEEITPYTTAQQEVYNAIKKSISYEGKTYINGSSDETNPMFEVVAKKVKQKIAVMGNSIIV